MRCLGRNLEDHCCYIDGKVCQFLEENTIAGFRWSCGLRRELGSWQRVIEDPRYKPIAKKLAAKNIPDCSQYPTRDAPCNYCGGGHADN